MLNRFWIHIEIGNYVVQNLISAFFTVIGSMFDQIENRVSRHFPFDVKRNVEAVSQNNLHAILGSP
jgi:Uri superfamily endonuclease